MKAQGYDDVIASYAIVNNSDVKNNLWQTKTEMDIERRNLQKRLLVNSVLLIYRLHGIRWPTIEEIQTYPDCLISRNGCGQILLFIHLITSILVTVKSMMNSSAPIVTAKNDQTASRVERTSIILQIILQIPYVTYDMQLISLDSLIQCLLNSGFKNDPTEVYIGKLGFALFNVKNLEFHCFSYFHNEK